MQLTDQTDYALRMLIQLAAVPAARWVPVRDIAEVQGLSVHHLLKIANRLAQHGFVQTRRGVGGGVRLGHAPAALTVGAVVRALEPRPGLVACMRDPPGACALTPSCRLPPRLLDAQEAFLAVLDGVTLDECAAPP